MTPKNTNSGRNIHNVSVPRVSQNKGTPVRSAPKPPKITRVDQNKWGD